MLRAALRAVGTSQGTRLGVMAVVSGSAVVLLVAGGCSSAGQPPTEHSAAASAPPAPTTTPVPVGSNAKLVTDFYTQAFVQRDVAGASQTYVAENYIQHTRRSPMAGRRS